MDSENPEEARRPQKSRQARWLTGLVILNAIVAVAAWIWGVFFPFGEMEAVRLFALSCLAILVLSVVRAFAIWTYRAWALPPMLFLAILCLLPSGTPKELARKMGCCHRLREIARAIEDYEAAKGEYPPAYLTGPDGKPWHSWRVLILPYLDRKDLYDQYRFDEPWDGPSNRKLHDAVVSQYHCPSDRRWTIRETETSYVAMVGPETLFPGGRSVRRHDVTDNRLYTVMLVEMRDSGIHWMEPRDLDMATMPMAVNARGGKGISSRHSDGAAAACATGLIVFLGNDTPPEKLRAILTIAGGEKVEW